MADNEAKVILGADIGAMVSGMADAAKAVATSVSQIKGMFEGLQATIFKFNNVFLGLQNLMAGGRLFAEPMRAAVEWNTEVLKLSRTMGITTEAASVMAVALDHIGLTTDQYASASVRLTRQLSTHEDAFHKLGIETRNQTTGAWLPLNQIVLQTTDRLGGLENATQQNIAAQKYFGRGWNDIRAILRLNADVMAEAAETAKRLNLIVGPEGAQMAWDYAAAQRDVHLIAKSLEIQIGTRLMPVMLALGKWMGKEGMEQVDTFTEVMQRIAVAAGATAFTFNALGQMLGGYAAQIRALLHGELDAMKAISAALNEELKRNLASYESFKDSILNPPPMKQSKDPGAGGTPIEFGKQDRLAEWKQELEQQKEATGEYFKNDLAAEGEFWVGKLALSERGSKEYVAVQHEIYQTLKAGAKQSTDYQIAELNRQSAAVKEDFNTRIKLAEQEYAILAQTYGYASSQAMAQRAKIEALEREAADRRRKDAADQIELDRDLSQKQMDIARDEIEFRAQTGQIDAQQRVQQLRAVLDEEYNVRADARDREIALARTTDEERRKLLADAQRDYMDYMRNVQKLNHEGAIAVGRDWDWIFNSIQGAFENAVRGMAQGTLTLQKAMRAIGNAMVGEFATFGVRMLASWVKTQMGMTLSTQDGVAMRNAAELWGAIKSIAIAAWAAIKKIAIWAWESAAGAYNAVVSIPYIGPFLAPAMAAAAAMAVLGFGARVISAEGGYDIPAGLNPMVQAHAREMVLPESLADKVRNMDDGGGSGMTVNLHVHAMDSHDVRRFMDEKGHLIADGLKKQMRDFRV